MFRRVLRTSGSFIFEIMATLLVWAFIFGFLWVIGFLGHSLSPTVFRVLPHNAFGQTVDNGFILSLSVFLLLCFGYLAWWGVTHRRRQEPSQQTMRETFKVVFLISALGGIVLLANYLFGLLLSFAFPAPFLWLSETFPVLFDMTVLRLMAGVFLLSFFAAPLARHAKSAPKYPPIVPW